MCITLIYKSGRKLAWQRRAKTRRGAKLRPRPKPEPSTKVEALPLLLGLDGLAGPPSFTNLEEDSEVSSLPAAMLRKLLAERLLPTEGKKADLVERFEAHRAFHDEAGFSPIFLGTGEREATGAVSVPAVPWPTEIPEAKSLALIQCWRSQETIHAWVQQDPKRWRYGRLSGRVGKAEGEDFDFEAPDLPAEKAADKSERPAPTKARSASKRKAAEEVVATPQRKRKRPTSPSSSAKQARPATRRAKKTHAAFAGKFAQLSSSEPLTALDLCPEPCVKPAVDLDDDSDACEILKNPAEEKAVLVWDPFNIARGL